MSLKQRPEKTIWRKNGRDGWGKASHLKLKPPKKQQQYNLADLYEENEIDKRHAEAAYNECMSNAAKNGGDKAMMEGICKKTLDDTMSKLEEIGNIGKGGSRKQKRSHKKTRKYGRSKKFSKKSKSFFFF